ncbi:MAG: VOC family protein [Pseudomonadota bacterium]
MTARLEHANLTSPDIDATITFLRHVDPAFSVLHDSGADEAVRWVHIGTPESYFAVQAPYEGDAVEGLPTRYHQVGVNHLGLVVEDVAAVAERLRAAGYAESYAPSVHPARLRRYFEDGCGFEWEFVQYLTEDPAERFAYG